MIQLEALTWGDPALPAVLCLHGAPGQASHFAPLAEALAPRHRVLAFNSPGYGASPSLPAPYTTEACTQAIVNTLAAHSVRRLAVVGHSLGAYRALALALSGEVEVTSVVALCGLAGIDAELAPRYRELAALARSEVDIEPVMRSALFASGYPEAHPEALAEVMGWVAGRNRAALAAEMDAMGALPDLRPRLGELRMPVLARVGTADASTPLAWSEAIASGAANGSLQIVEGVGHAILHEDRDATIAAVVQALR